METSILITIILCRNKKLADTTYERKKSVLIILTPTKQFFFVYKLSF